MNDFEVQGYEDFYNDRRENPFDQHLEWDAHCSWERGYDYAHEQYEQQMLAEYERSEYERSMNLDW